MPGSSTGNKLGHGQGQVGLKDLYCSKNPRVDIIFVHGLNGDRIDTWTNKDNGVCWPADLLPQFLEPVGGARIMTYGYNANVAAFTDSNSSSSISRDKLHHHAETLASLLVANRSLRSCSERPIVWVCHSLGGLVVKRLLVLCRNTTNEKIEHLRSLYVSTYGILFLGTPHNGSDIAKWGLLLQKICNAVLPKSILDSSPHLVNALKTNNETLQNINALFADMMGRFHIYFFHETQSTNLKGTRDVIVDESSAAPYIEGTERMGIEADHSQMCKFADADAPGFEAVAEALVRYSKDASTVIAERWIEERKARFAERMAKVNEIYSMGGPASRSAASVPDGAATFIGNSLASLRDGRDSPVPQLARSTDLQRSTLSQKDALFVVPPGFHPNANFFGMQKELEVLHIRAFKWKKRADRLAAVLICGGPGCGKSHLARQYVWMSRDDYPGGIFWIDAKSKESTEKCFWDIAQAAALMDGKDFENPDARSSNRYVDAVRKWFEGREEWLLIFDGLSFSRDADISLFRQFLPFNHRCTIIYTSVDKTLSKKSRLFEPYGLQVAPLEIDDACKLLFRDLGIKRPTPDQARKAREIVKHYECLPLAIHAISHRLSATSKPIEKYQLTSHLTDERLAEPFLGIMHDLFRLEQYEALNLINLLSFFSHHIPVALITLGSSALETWRVEILTSSRSGDDPDIDTTLGTLIKHGLIERFADVHVLLSKDSFQQSSEGDSPVDLKAVTPELSESQTESSQSALMAMYQHSGTIDVIKIHSVVQGFCRDELTIMDRERKGHNTLSEGFYNSWLVVATKVFCKSYEMAKVKMQGLTDSDLVKDYREYETHASRLLEHFPKRKFKGSHSEVSAARTELRHALKSIRREIEQISPSSSQESLGKHKSVFDRSGSSSSSVPGSSTDEGPSRQLTMNMGGRDHDVPQFKSPAAAPASSQLFNLGPFPPHIYRMAPPDDTDGGYETDGEGSRRAIQRLSPTHSVMSDATQRYPGSQASSPPGSYETGDWHIVQSKPQKEQRPRKKRGFPSYFQGASSKPIPPLVKVSSVQGEGASSRSSRTASSDSTVIASEAAKALAAVHLASTAPKAGRGPSTATYATVAAGRANETVPSSTKSSPWFGPRRSPLALTLQTQSSRESLRSRTSNLQPSPLTNDAMSQSMYCETEHINPSAGLGPGLLNPRSLPGSRHDSRRPSTAMSLDRAVDLSASTPAALTYLPPIQYEENIAFTISRRMGSTPVPVATELAMSTLVSSIAHPSAFMPGTSPPNIIPQDVGGSASDPTSLQMSRGPSGRSEESRATEPPQLPSRYTRFYANPNPASAEAALGPNNVPGSAFQKPMVLGAGTWTRDVPQQQQQQFSLPRVSLGFGPSSATRPAGGSEGARRNSK